MRTSPSTTGFTSVASAEGSGAGGGARAVEIEADLPAHDLGLFAHLFGQGRALRIGFVHQHAERRFERMGEIADLGAGALDDLAVGVDQLVDLGRQRRDVLRKFARDMLGLAAADGGDAFLEHSERTQAESNRERRRADQRQRERQKSRGERQFEAALLRLDHVGVGGDLHQEAPVVAGVDLALDHPELMTARADRIAAENGAVIAADRDQLRQLGREQRLRGANFRRVHVGAGDLPVPARERELELRRDRRLGRRPSPLRSGTATLATSALR